MKTTEKKYEFLKDEIRKMGRVGIAFSSGVDSTFLLNTSLEVLGKENVIAFTGISASFPEREKREAKAFCKEKGVKQICFDPEMLKDAQFVVNPTDRCYHCKSNIFGKIKELAGENGISHILEGSNADDKSDYRPGFKAIQELGIESPLMTVGLTKDEIRMLSKAQGLYTWDKPAYACLASRFVYGETIDKNRLEMTDRAEQLLIDLGFKQVRVRVHGMGKNTVARIETEPDEIARIVRDDIRNEIYTKFKEYGFAYVALDMKGYRMGSMNETIKISDNKSGE
ncbi:MAG: ATP-dependent sacrificial sulfur transferase LarE [Lachnospiraceae bacterium]|nr:ATP-dependent sacrificial sulfur transferase LarE [Lachnospiraceae bacterium]